MHHLLQMCKKLLCVNQITTEVQVKKQTKLLCVNQITTEVHVKKTDESRNASPNTMKSEVATAPLNLCSACYTALQANNSVRNFFTISHFREKHNKASGKPHCTIANQHLALSVKRTGTQRRTKAAHWCLLCSCCGWWKGMPHKETSNSEEIKSIALSICLAEGISYLVSQLASRNFS